MPYLSWGSQRHLPTLTPSPQISPWLEIQTTEQLFLPHQALQKMALTFLTSPHPILSTVPAVPTPHLMLPPNQASRVSRQALPDTTPFPCCSSPQCLLQGSNCSRRFLVRPLPAPHLIWIPIATPWGLFGCLTPLSKRCEHRPGSLQGWEGLGEGGRVGGCETGVVESKLLRGGGTGSLRQASRGWAESRIQERHIGLTLGQRL